jgi:hypothetical protein
MKRPASGKRAMAIWYDAKDGSLTSPRSRVGLGPLMQPEKRQEVRPVDPLACRQSKLLKINVRESMLSPSLPMSLHARRSPSGRAHSEPARRTKDWKIAAVNTQSMYCIALRNKFDKTIIGWYDASASNFSTDQRRAKLFLDRVDAYLVAGQLRRMYPRLAQDIEVTPVQPTTLIYSSESHSHVAMILSPAAPRGMRTEALGSISFKISSYLTTGVSLDTAGS